MLRTLLASSLTIKDIDWKKNKHDLEGKSLLTKP